MKSQNLGMRTSKIEVLNVSLNGIWLLVIGKEYFLPYENFPWFKNASISQIHTVELRHDHYLSWKELDVDLELASLENLDQYPLKYV
jgi:hypothetical protein